METNPTGSRKLEKEEPPKQPPTFGKPLLRLLGANIEKPGAPFVARCISSAHHPTLTPSCIAMLRRTYIFPWMASSVVTCEFPRGNATNTGETHNTSVPTPTKERVIFITGSEITHHKAAEGRTELGKLRGSLLLHLLDIEPRVHFACLLGVGARLETDKRMKYRVTD